MHICSLMKQIVDVGRTSIQILPALFTGQLFLHSYLQTDGLHLLGSIIAALRELVPILAASTIYNFNCYYYKR